MCLCLGIIFFIVFAYRTTFIHYRRRCQESKYISCVSLKEEWKNGNRHNERGARWQQRRQWRQQCCGWYIICISDGLRFRCLSLRSFDEPPQSFTSLLAMLIRHWYPWTRWKSSQRCRMNTHTDNNINDDADDGVRRKTQEPRRRSCNAQHPRFYNFWTNFRFSPFLYVFPIYTRIHKNKLRVYLHFRGAIQTLCTTEKRSPSWISCFPTDE